MGEDQPTAEANARGDHQRVNRHLAPAPRSGQQMARQPGDPHTRGDNASEAPTKQKVNRLIRVAASIDLDEDR